MRLYYAVEVLSHLEKTVCNARYSAYLYVRLFKDIAKEQVAGVVRSCRPHRWTTVDALPEISRGWDGRANHGMQPAPALPPVLLQRSDLQENWTNVLRAGSSFSGLVVL